MNEEYVRELLRTQRERQNSTLQRQQQLQIHNANLQQLGQGLETSSPSVSTMLSRARSPVGASTATGPSALDYLTSPQRASTTNGQSALDYLTSPQRASTATEQSALNYLTSPLRTSDYTSVVNTSLLSSAMVPSAMRTSARASAVAARAAVAAENEAQLSNLAISKEIKRLQDLQQHMTSNIAPNTTSNPFLYASQMPYPSPSQMGNPNSTILQQYLQEKAQLPQLSRMNPNQSVLSTSLMSNTGPIRASADAANQAVLESKLLQEARILMRRQSMPPTFAAAAAAKAPSPFPSLSPPSVSNQAEGCRKMRGGVIEPFPEKLHRLLLEVEFSGRSNVISFVSEGRAFAIHNNEVFFREIVPLYFRQSRLSSFKRQLNLYGFEPVNTGPTRGAYYHELFHRDHPERCRRMRRVAVKVSAAKQPAAAVRASEDEQVGADDGSSSEGEVAVNKIIEAGVSGKKQEEDTEEK